MKNNLEELFKLGFPCLIVARDLPILDDFRFLAEKYNIPVIAKIPMDPTVAAKCDAGDIEYCEENWLEPVTNVLAQLG